MRTVPTQDEHDHDAEDGSEDHGGETALSIAAEKGYLTVVRLLLQHGADPALPRGDGLLPAVVAKENGFSAIHDLIAKQAN